MFPFWSGTCWEAGPSSRKNYQERRLQFLRWMRDDLETRLAGLNAAIESIERQLRQDDTTTV